MSSPRALRSRGRRPGSAWARSHLVVVALGALGGCLVPDDYRDGAGEVSGSGGGGATGGVGGGATGGVGGGATGGVAGVGGGCGCGPEVGRCCVSATECGWVVSASCQPEGAPDTDCAIACAQQGQCCATLAGECGEMRGPWCAPLGSSGGSGGTGGGGTGGTGAGGGAYLVVSGGQGEIRWLTVGDRYLFWLTGAGALQRMDTGTEVVEDAVPGGVQAYYASGGALAWYDGNAAWYCADEACPASSASAAPMNLPFPGGVATLGGSGALAFLSTEVGSQLLRWSPSMPAAEMDTGVVHGGAPSNAVVTVNEGAVCWLEASAAVGLLCAPPRMPAPLMRSAHGSTPLWPAAQGAWTYRLTRGHDASANDASWVAWSRYDSDQVMAVHPSGGQVLDLRLPAKFSRTDVAILLERLYVGTEQRELYSAPLVAGAIPQQIRVFPAVARTLAGDPRSRVLYAGLENGEIWAVPIP